LKAAYWDIETICHSVRYFIKCQI